MSENDPILSAGNSLPAPPSAATGGQVRSDVAAKTILSRLLEAIEAHEAGVLQNLDPENLHDYRIAIRRSRSAIGQIKGAFPDRVVQNFKPRFAWLGDITSTPRDLDVYLLGFDELKAALPEPFREGIEHLRGFLENHADFAHAELTRHIHSKRYRKLIGDWKKFLNSPAPKRPTALQALRPIRETADLRIFKLFRRALKQGKAIRPTTPAENIHELRKTCKKLRYLLEFFRDLYPQEEINRPIKQLKKLQDYLGEFQDVHASIAMLQGISHEMRQSHEVPTEALLALGALLSLLEQRQHSLRKEFPEHFAPFAHDDNRTRFRKLFKPHVAVKKLPPP